MHTEELYLLILQLSRTFYVDDPTKETDPFRMGFIWTFLTCFLFVIKAFCASFFSLSGMPSSTIGPVLGLQPLGHLAASFSYQTPWKPVTFVLHIVPACSPSASPVSFILFFFFDLNY